MEVRAYNGLQTISNKANQLNSYYVLTGETDYLATDLSRYLNVTPDSVHQQPGCTSTYRDVWCCTCIHSTTPPTAPSWMPRRFRRR